MGHGERYKRLGIIVVLFLLILFLYSAQAVFTGDTSNYESQSTISTNNIPDDDPGLFGSLGAVAGFFGFLFGGLILKAPEFPIYFSVIIYPIYFIILLAFWYVVIDFIKDIYETFIPG